MAAPVQRPAMRVIRHLFARGAQRTFPESSLQRVSAAIAAAELGHGGEVCFAVESALPIRSVFSGVSARDRALQVFAQLRVWDTEANNGVLVYLLLADHRLEIVADRGVASMVSDAQWRGVCLLMEERLAAGEAEAAAIAGVVAVSELLALHFPRAAGQADENELPDLPILLD